MTAFYTRCGECRELVTLTSLRDEVTCECGNVVVLVPVKLRISENETARALESLDNMGKRDFIKFP